MRLSEVGLLALRRIVEDILVTSGEYTLERRDAETLAKEILWYDMHGDDGPKEME
jgi:hypothetical protein